MHVVAIHHLEKDKETLSGALAAAMESTVYEALSRLRSPGAGPLTVGVFAERERAERLEKRLNSAGFKALILSAEEIGTEAGGRLVKRFSLGEHDLAVETGKSGGISISFADIELILRGIGIASSTVTETAKKRSLSPGRAILSGGMLITKTTKSVREVTTEEREGFFNLYAGEGPTLVFRENTLVYDSLGPVLRPSRTANLAYLIAELRRRCPGIRYDERLLNRAGQVALLGTSLNPEEHLVVATALLAKALRTDI